MNVLIIGGNGFIGSHLVDIFLKKNFKVRVFDQFKEKYREPLSKVDYRLYSIKNLDALNSSMKDIDIVIHLASSSVPSTSNLDPILDVNNNLIDSLNILNASVKQGVRKIVYFSSGGAIYESNSLPIKENFLLNPISSYGIIKSTIEFYIKLYEKLYNIKTLIIRPSNPYGPRQGNFLTQGVISNFLKKVKINESLLVYGDGNSSKDYIYIDDLANIVFELVKEEINGIYNIGVGYGTSLNKIIEVIKNVTNKSFDIQYTTQQKSDIPNFVLDIEKLKQVIGVEYDFKSIDYGIGRTWDWINENNA